LLCDGQEDTLQLLQPVVHICGPILAEKGEIGETGKHGNGIQMSHMCTYHRDGRLWHWVTLERSQQETGGHCQRWGGVHLQERGAAEENVRGKCGCRLQLSSQRHHSVLQDLQDAWGKGGGCGEPNTAGGEEERPQADSAQAWELANRGQDDSKPWLRAKRSSTALGQKPMTVMAPATCGSGSSSEYSMAPRALPSSGVAIS
jgi:hypothetical protein